MSNLQIQMLKDKDDYYGSLLKQRVSRNDLNSVEVDYSKAVTTTGSPFFSGFTHLRCPAGKKTTTTIKIENSTDFTVAEMMMNVWTYVPADPQQQPPVLEHLVFVNPTNVNDDAPIYIKISASGVVIPLFTDFIHWKFIAGDGIHPYWLELPPIFSRGTTITVDIWNRGLQGGAIYYVDLSLGGLKTK